MYNKLLSKINNANYCRRYWTIALDYYWTIASANCALRIMSKGLSNNISI